MERFDLSDYLDCSALTLTQSHVPLYPRQPTPLPLTMFSLVPLRGFQAKALYDAGEVVHLSPSPLVTNLCNAYPLLPDLGCPFHRAVKDWKASRGLSEAFFYRLSPFREFVLEGETLFQRAVPSGSAPSLAFRLSSSPVRRYLAKERQRFAKFSQN